MSSLSDVTIVVTAFLRDGYLFECLDRISSALPECSVIVVDDGMISTEKTAKLSSVKYIPLTFDSGLSAKRNAASKAAATKYVLMGHDDFDFAPCEVRRGIQRMVEVLDNDNSVAVAGGHYKNQSYEGFLEIVPGQYIKETRLIPNGKQDYYQVDIIVNYFLARVEVLVETPWDERMKISGEHGDWFLSLKEKGKKVVWVPGVNINELHISDPNAVDPSYLKFRERVEGHSLFLQKYGVSKFFGFGSTTTKVNVSDVLIAIITCEKNHDRVQRQLDTWIPVAREIGYDVQIFDGVRLGVPDDYASLPLKTKALCKWALTNKYKHVLKIDDDGLIRVDRFKKIENDYAGILIGPNDLGCFRIKVPNAVTGTYPSPYCSGGAYWMSERSMRIIAETEINDWAEDRWVGNTLAKNGISPTVLSDYVIVTSPLNSPQYERYTVLTQLADQGGIPVNIPVPLPVRNGQVIQQTPRAQRIVSRHNIIRHPRIIDRRRLK